MSIGILDLIVFVGFLAAVVGVSLYAGRRERTSEDYFLAGRSLTWPLIGFSLIASNISTEHFVGMAGSAFGRVGMAIASYEWMAAVTLIIVGWWFLPRFLSAGIYTMPEYLEYRYDSATRSIMAVYLMVLYVVALLATVLYSGAKGLDGVFGFSEMLATRFDLEPQQAVFWATILGAWAIGLVAAAYTIYGGLKAVVWSDLLQGGALLIGGAIVTWLCLRLIGGGEVVPGGGVTGGSALEGARNFWEVNTDKLHTVLPWNDPDVPWLAVFVGGLWIPNLFYWGMNQFITQRTLAARSLAEGQKGILLAAGIKLTIPFIVVVPGIIAYQVYADPIIARAGGDPGKANDIAYPYLISQVLPPLLRGVMLAALAGAVMSTFNSAINSASTIFTIDLYKKYIRPDADARREVTVGRWATAGITLLACLMAPLPGRFAGVFAYIQEIWGFISPGIVACFLGGMILRRAPAAAGRTVLILGPILYALFRLPGWVLEAKEKAGDLPPTGVARALYDFSTIAFLHHMAIVFVILFSVMAWMAWRDPLAAPRTMPRSNLNLEPWRYRYPVGGSLIGIAAALYLIFW